MNLHEEKTFRVLNRGVLQCCRWLLVLVCLSVAGFLLLTGKRIGIGIILLLTGLWLVLDNPLESFETLEGSCPSCGHKVKNRRCIDFRCSECGKPITVGPDCFYFVDSETFSDPDSRVLKESQEEASQVEPIVISAGDTLDLHTFSPKEVVSLLNEFIDLSQKADIKFVSIIHGKGTGALRRRVRGLLAGDPRVVDYYNAPPKSGGWGATVVELKPRQEGESNEPCA